MSSEFIISSITSALDDELSGNLYPNLFGSSQWLKVLAAEYDFEFLKAGIANSNHFLVVVNTNQFGVSKIKGLPFCDYVIPSAPDAETLNHLINRLKKDYPDLPVELKVVLPGNINPEELNHPIKHTAYRHLVDTSSSLEAIEETMDNSFVRGVRKAESFDLQITLAHNKDALDEFYAIYSKQRVEKFKKLPQPSSFFEKIYQAFIQNNHGFILEAKKDDIVIASMIILEHKETLYYKFGCSLHEYLDYRPNNALFYRLFKHAQSHNFKQVDLGLSGVSKAYKGLVRFKEYMGGQPDNIYSMRLDPENYDPTAEKQLNTFTSSLTESIISQKPNRKTANAYSEILYPYFA